MEDLHLSISELRLSAELRQSGESTRELSVFFFFFSHTNGSCSVTTTEKNERSKEIMGTKNECQSLSKGFSLS